MALIVLVSFLAYQGIIPLVVAGVCIVLKGVSMFLSVSGYLEQKKSKKRRSTEKKKDVTTGGETPFSNDELNDELLDAQIDSLEAELKNY